MAAVQSVREQLYAYGDAASNGSLKDSLLAQNSLPFDSSFLQSKVIWGFSLLLVVVLAKVFGSKEKLPAGTRPLPKLPGMFKRLRVEAIVDTNFVHRPAIWHRTILGHSSTRR